MQLAVASWRRRNSHRYEKTVRSEISIVCEIDSEFKSWPSF